MGKRKGRKRKNRTYNQKDFVGIFCSQCDFCPEGAKPIFCYQELYRYLQRQFVNDVFQNLLDACGIFRKASRPLNSITVEHFRKIVCETGVCHNGDGDAGTKCDKIRGCYMTFREQMGEQRLLIHSLHSDEEHVPKVSRKGNKAKETYVPYLANNNKKKKKKQKRYVVEAYPTYFSSDRDGFKEKVKRIIDGDNTDKSNSDQESTGEFRGRSDESSESGESKVS